MDREIGNLLIWEGPENQDLNEIERKKEKRMKKVGVFIIVLVLLAASFFAGYNFAKNKDKPDTEYTEKDITSKIVEISDLAAYASEYDVTIGKNDSKYIFDDIKLFFTTNHITLSATGIVKVGYDVSNIKIKLADNTIYISLPEPKVLDNYVIWDSVICKEKNNLINPIEFKQYKDIITEIETMGLKDAEKNGVYDKANEHAKKIIDAFLSEFSGYNIEYI